MDPGIYLRFVLALVFVIALIAAIAWVMRRFNVLGRLAAPRKGGARIGVVEVTPVDAKRRLVLVRRDDVEHLVLIGPAGDVVVESGIPAGRVRAIPPAREMAP
ncbi:MAG TPA: flagellar biosynthetic protein FliO [Alphaproteobacteria bacterium]|jgi:flagellar protein FliO/FliZ